MATTGMCSSISAMGPCFISPAGIALGVDVADLLELERPFQRDGEIDAPAQVEEIGALEKGLREILVDFVVLYVQ